jgi:hypothetical protein
MARTTKEGLDFFKLSVDFFVNDKIRLIEAEFGWKGSAIAIRLLCKIYKEDFYYQWGDDQCLLFSKAIGDGVAPSLVNEVVKGLVKRGFFNKALFDSFKILTSKGIQNRFFDAVVRYKKVCVISEYLLVDVSKMINVNIYSLNDNINTINDSTCTHKDKDKDNEKEKEKKNARVKTAPPPPVLKNPVSTSNNSMLNFEETWSEFFNSEKWIETICMSNSLEKDFVISDMEKFLKKLDSEDIFPRKLSDTKSHYHQRLQKYLKLESEKKSTAFESNKPRISEFMPGPIPKKPFRP